MSKVITADAEKLKEILEESNLVLLDFYADWCGPCKTLIPILDEVSERNKDITVVKINVDLNSDLAREYGVRSIPQLFIIKDGKKVDSFTGMQSLDFLEEKIKNHS